MSDAARIQQIQQEIDRKRTALEHEQAELRKVQREIDAFAKQYDHTLGALEAQLDAVQQQIESLRASSQSTYSMWGPYNSFEESFDAKYRRSGDDYGPKPTRQTVSDETLRTVYRQLVRRYHPDTTTNPDEKAWLTTLMAQVNAAYRARDARALYALDGQRADLPLPKLEPLAPRTPTLFDLTEQSRKLDGEITDTQIAYRNLMRSPLMTLKIEHSLARARGTNLLHEIADRVRAELVTAQAELDKLRRG